MPYRLWTSQCCSFTTTGIGTGLASQQCPLHEWDWEVPFTGVITALSLIYLCHYDSKTNHTSHFAVATLYNRSRCKHTKKTQAQLTSFTLEFSWSVHPNNKPCTNKWCNGVNKHKLILVLRCSCLYRICRVKCKPYFTAISLISDV